MFRSVNRSNARGSTGTQLDFTSRHVQLGSGGSQAGPRFYLARNPPIEPGPTMASLAGAALRTITPHSSEVMSSRGTNLLRSDDTEVD
jgi:hypothetical protein